MRYSIDGGVTFQDAPEGVLVVYEDVDIPGEDEPGMVYVNLTNEGIVTDVWATKNEPLDHNIGTDGWTVDEMVERLVEENQ